MNRSAAVIAVLACFAVAVLTACGSDDSGGSSTADNAAATNAETTAPTPAATNSTATAPAPAPAASTTTQPADKPTDKATVVARCHQLFDPVLVQLRQIEKMVDGTPRFATYRAATKKLENRYSTFNANSIPSDSCLQSVSIPTTTAYLSYYGAGNFWLECRKRDDCAKVMPKIKKQWRDASKLIVKGSNGFAKVTAN